jgi:ceramide glucosyltransferase
VNPLAVQVPAALAAVLCATGVAQTLAGLIYVRRFARDAPAAGASLPPITVLKPLYNGEPLLTEALETFFRQDYPSLQLVFGVQRADDPAIPIVRALQARYEHIDAVLIVDPTPHGKNRKIANLINMFPAARHDLLVVSDSDMHVAPDYLRRVAAAFAAQGVGLVTSLYVGKPATRGITPWLGAAYINQIFAAGAVVARALGRQDCLGATMAFSRATLCRIGGFAALSPYVADDGVLGRMVVASGQTIALAATVPATTVADEGLAALFRHELRWSRTIRAMAPAIFPASLVQYPVFWALLAASLAPAWRWPFGLLALAVAVRALCGRLIERALGAAPTPLWLAPLRDVFSVAVMAAAYAGEKVAWHDQVLSTQADRTLVRGEGAFAARPPVRARILTRADGLAHGER